MSRDILEQPVRSNGSGSVVSNLALKNSPEGKSALIDGRFRALSCLGRGSDGTQYLCEHIDVADQKLVIKILDAVSDKEGEESAARFKNEIIAAYKVYHPNVARIYEFIHKDDLFAYTMEYVEGGNLRSYMDEHAPIDIEHIAQMLFQICAGAQALHAAGIIHRNLKPQSILLTKQGNVKIGNFGVVRICNHSRLTAHDSLVGTLDYLSPEYLMRGVLDKRLDIYAIGIVAYEMLTGNPPLHAESLTKTLFRRLNEDAVPPHLLREDCPPELSAVVTKALRRNPEDRYQDLSEMIADLRPIVPEFAEASGIRIEETPLRLSSSPDGLNVENAPLRAENGAGKLREPWEDPVSTEMRPLQSVELLALCAIVFFVALSAWGLYRAMSQSENAPVAAIGTGAQLANTSEQNSEDFASVKSELPLLKSSLRLVGLHLGAEHSLAIIDDSETNKQDVFREGDLIWEKGQLLEIKPDHVVIEVDDARFFLPKKSLSKVNNK